jgi:hypothetical protein
MSVTEVPISADSLNSGDVFILDMGAQIYVWTGAGASVFEKNKALTQTLALRDDRDHQGKSQVRAPVLLICRMAYSMVQLMSIWVDVC